MVESLVAELAIGLGVALGLMAATWWVAGRINNYSIVDGVWAGSFSLIAVVFASMAKVQGPRRFWFLVVVCSWSLRLCFYLTRRIASHHPQEDGRYLDLRVRYAPHVKRGFFWFFQMQGLSVAALSVPFAIAFHNPRTAPSLVEWIGGGLALLSLAGEALADGQMSQFKKILGNRGKTCKVGLWRFSRHPNYFFESMIWWGFYMMALGSPGGWATIYCPLGMLYLLLKVTGVPMAEAQALKSRGEEFRRYQRETSVFVPWFPKLLP